MAQNVTTSDPQKDAAPAEEEFILTPEILAYENRRNDLIIAVGVILCGFFLGTFKETYPDLFLHLATGRAIAENGIPKTDPFSFGAPEGKAWINPNWLFDRGLFGLYTSIGDTALCVLKAVVCGLIGGMLLLVRHKGPTLWWTAVCGFFAAIAVAPRLFIGPEVFALFCFGSILAIWHAARYSGRFSLLYLAVPVAAIWANIDSSFFIAGLTLAALTLGEVLQLFLPRSWNFGGRGLSTVQIGQAALVAVLCLVAGAATPYGMETLRFPLAWFTEVLPQASYTEKQFFGWNSILAPTVEGNPDRAFFARLLDWNLTYPEAAWVGLAVAALSSFFLNFLRLNAGRILLFLIGVGLPFIAARYSAPGAMILATIVALNGQEWFLDYFGTEPRIERGWVLWSQAGRFLTILGLFLSLLFCATGRAVEANTGLFGFGIADYYFVDKDSAEWLKNSGLKGRAFCPAAVRIPAALAWHAPEVKSFVDSRWQLFSDVPKGVDEKAPSDQKNSTLQNYVMAQRALVNIRGVDNATARQVFNRYKISHMLFDPNRDVDRSLMLLDDSLPLHLSKRMVVVGRGEKWEGDPDRETIQKLKIRANELAFNPPPPPKDSEDRPAELTMNRPAYPPGVVDWLWRFRYLPPTGLGVAKTWAEVAFGLERPGQIFMAVRELRKAIFENPDNPETRLELSRNYERLLDIEQGEAINSMTRQRIKAQMKRRAETDGKDKSKSDPAKKAAPPKDPAKADSAKTAPKKAGEPEVEEIKADNDIIAAAQQFAASEQARPSRMFSPLRHFQLFAAYRDSLRTSMPEGVSAWLTSGRPLKADEYIRMATRCERNGFLDQQLEILKLANAQINTLPQAGRDYLNKKVPAVSQQVDKQLAVYDQRLAEVRKQIEAQGGTGDSLVYRIRSCLDLGLPLKAIREFEEARTTDPEYEMARPLALEAYLNLGFISNAEELLPQINTQMQRGRAKYLEAQILLATGDYDRARTAMESAIGDVRQQRLMRNITAASYLFRGIVLEKMQDGSLSGTIGERRSTIEDLGLESEWNYELGLILLEMGKSKEAMKAFEESLAANPSTLHRHVVIYYAKKIKGAKVPDEGNLYFIEDELAIRFPPKAAPVKANDPKGADAKKAEEPKKDAAPKVDSAPKK